MRREITVVGLVLSTCLLWGCTSLKTSSGANYWFIYKTDSGRAPGSVYTGYYKDEGTTLNDQTIERCLENDKCQAVDKVLSADKPFLTDYDQAKVVLFRNHVADPKGQDLKNVECNITQTKITRVPNPIFMDTTVKLPAGAQRDSPPPPPSVFFCGLPVTDAGGMRLDYIIRPHGGSPPPPPELVKDSLEVHTLYRFRLIAGPVHSSLSDRERNFMTKPHSGGNSFIGSDVKGDPINAVIFLKYYWQPRDVYDTKWCWDGKTDKYEKWTMSCLGRINPIVGVNVSDNPLNSVYLGMSVDILPGLDLVGGVHWASIEKLSGGFSQGQIVPSDTSISTEKRFLPGWFAGIAVDLGVVGSWLGKATMGMFK